MAEQIPDARLVEWATTTSRSPATAMDEMEEFLTGTRQSRPLDRVLATVMFTDIVGIHGAAPRMPEIDAGGSSSSATTQATRRQLDRYRGQEVKTLGAWLPRHLRWPGPWNRVRLRDPGRRFTAGPRGASRPAHRRVRAAPGRRPRHGGNVALGAVAEANEVLVSSTVKDLVVGADLEFADRGEHELKGVHVALYGGERCLVQVELGH